MKFHHLGIACKNIENEQKSVKKLFPNAVINEIVYDPLQKTELSLISIDGLTIELVSGDPVKALIDKGISYYHVCYSVKNIDNKIENFTNNGAFIVSSPKPAILFNNRKVAFLYTNLGLIELLEQR